MLAEFSKHLEDFKIPRNIGTEYSNQHGEIHCFCDSSDRMYACVVYLKIVTPNSVVVDIVASKSKMFPLNSELTMPRKELVSCVLGVRFLNTVSSAIGRVDTIFYWSDSMVCL